MQSDEVGTTSEEKKELMEVNIDSDKRIRDYHARARALWLEKERANDLALLRDLERKKKRFLAERMGCCQSDGCAEPVSHGTKMCEKHRLAQNERSNRHHRKIRGH